MWEIVQLHLVNLTLGIVFNNLVDRFCLLTEPNIQKKEIDWYINRGKKLCGKKSKEKFFFKERFLKKSEWYFS